MVSVKFVRDGKLFSNLFHFRPLYNMNAPMIIIILKSIFSSKRILSYTFSKQFRVTLENANYSSLKYEIFWTEEQK